MIYQFNFSESLEEINKSTTKIVGNPQIFEDLTTGKKACFFDGNSAIEIPSVNLDKSDFYIQCIFRNVEQTRESGIFGSNGFKCAYRSNRGELSYTFWANFPSSVHPKKIDNKNAVNFNDEHFIEVIRTGDTFTLYDNCKRVGEVIHPHQYWSMPLYIGYYYDLLYGFHGYIREFKLNIGESKVPETKIPETLSK